MSNETISEFKNSFFYGQRTDLSFKFLKDYSDEEAAVFIQTLFTKTVDAMDSGDWQPVAQHVIDGQAAAYNKPGHFAYDDAPFAPLPKPLSNLKLGLLTSSGHFVDGNDPQPFGEENMSQLEATARISQFLGEAPTLSAIPMDTPPEKLRVRHGGYDIRGAAADHNVVLPLTHLQALANSGAIGQLADNAYSFVGACAQTPLRKKSVPQWATMLKEQAIEAMVLLPAWPVCHVSVGHVARVLEAAGIPTVTIAVAAFAAKLAPMQLPRLLLTPFLMGRPLGAPNDDERQRDVLQTGLRLLETAVAGATVVHYPHSWLLLR